MIPEVTHQTISGQPFGRDYLALIEDFLTGVRAQRLLDSLYRLIRQAMWIFDDIVRNT